MFREEDIKIVLQNFPKFELCYEIITHKKVLGANVMLAIPEGKKCFAWFTIYKNNNVCFLLEINENKNITKEQEKRFEKLNSIHPTKLKPNEKYEFNLLLGKKYLYLGSLKNIHKMRKNFIETKETIL
jgi:hypothetical protein